MNWIEPEKEDQDGKLFTFAQLQKIWIEGLAFGQIFERTGVQETLEETLDRLNIKGIDPQVATTIQGDISANCESSNKLKLAQFIIMLSDFKTISEEVGYANYAANQKDENDEYDLDAIKEYEILKTRQMDMLSIWKKTYSDSFNGRL